VIGALYHGVEFVVRDGNLRSPVEEKCYRSSSLRCLGHSSWLRMQSVKEVNYVTSSSRKAVEMFVRAVQ
jgi:hypothetical protein